MAADPKRCNEERAGYIEAKVTEHTIHRDSRPKSHKMMEQAMTDALSEAILANA